MVNITEVENDTSIEDIFCSTRLLRTHERIIIAAFNIPLSITAFLGNVLIITALQKPSSLHPPSKLLLGCLAITDLCVGLISQPLRVTYLLSPNHSRRCYYAERVSDITALIFCAVSLLTMTAISMDRLLALILGLRYRHVVTLRRVWVLVVILWLLTTAIATTIIYNDAASFSIVGTLIFLCLITSTFCYIKIYLRLRQHQAQLQEHVDQGQQNGGRIPMNVARYKKTVSSALWVQLTLVACYLPFGIAQAIFAFNGFNTPVSLLGWEATAGVLMLKSSVNPFIYSWKIKEIRQSVKDTIRQLCCFSS